MSRGRLAAALLPLLFAGAASSAVSPQPEAPQEARMPLKEGDSAPAFEAKTDEGKTVKLSDFKGKNVVLYFYPKDDTPGCTKQACSFRDNMSAFGKKNAVVLGVSLDDAASHTAFKKKYGLPFTLLADAGGEIAKAYGVLDGAYADRWTFVIDPAGKIKKVFPDVKVDGHSAEVLECLN
jgi:thioredoxin-dependent peroxiredoxin